MRFLMTWKKYKLLSEQDRREYDYRFKDKKVSSGIVFFVPMVIILFSMLLVKVALIYTVIMNDAFVDVRPVFKEQMLPLVVQSYQGIIIIAIAGIFIELGVLLYYAISEMIWVYKHVEVDSFCKGQRSALKPAKDAEGLTNM